MRALCVVPALIFAAFGVAASASAASQVGLTTVRPSPTASGAEKLHRLEIMLRITAQRCRRAGEDFTSDYRGFVAQQMPSLGAARAQLGARLAAQYGSRGGHEAFDRLSDGIADGYRRGHPWLGCRELGQAARNLAQIHGRATLEEAADQLVSRAGSRMAYAKR